MVLVGYQRSCCNDEVPNCSQRRSPGGAYRLKIIQNGRKSDRINVENELLNNVEEKEGVIQKDRDEDQWLELRFLVKFDSQVILCAIGDCVTFQIENNEKNGCNFRRCKMAAVNYHYVDIPFRGKFFCP